MRSRHPRTALVLLGMVAVLLASIAVGQQIGERALFSATQRRLQFPDASITPVPEPTASADALTADWKRLQVVSVATDPAFPDPRITPTPVPLPRPSPTRRPTPAPRPSASPSPTGSPADLYTSPPLPLPLASHEPGEDPLATPAP